MHYGTECRYRGVTLTGTGCHNEEAIVDSAVLVVEQDEADLVEETPVTEELLVEEISIDGMCGVY